MKIVHIVESFGGGVYTYFKDLANFFAQQKQVETYIIYSNNRKEVSEEKIYNDFPKNIKLISVDMERELKPFKDLQSTFKLRKLLKHIKPDVVHLHSSKAGVIGRWATTSLSKIKHVYYTPHGYSFLRLDISPIKRKIFYSIEKLTQFLFGGITVACGDTEYKIASKIGKSKLIRNGIDIDKLSKYYQKTSSKNSKITIGTIGRIMPQKDPSLFNQIALSYPQYNFIWVGDGDLKDKLSAPNIIITGWIHDSLDIYKYLNKIDIYIQTSLWEGLPIAVLEAMAFHKPIIATNVIGNKDIVIPGYNGYLFENITNLETILPLIEDRNHILKLGANAYNDCITKYDKDQNFKSLLMLYQTYN